MRATSIHMHCEEGMQIHCQAPRTICMERMSDLWTCSVVMLSSVCIGVSRWNSSLLLLLCEYVDLPQPGSGAYWDSRGRKRFMQNAREEFHTSIFSSHPHLSGLSCEPERGKRGPGAEEDAATHHADSDGERSSDDHIQDKRPNKKARVKTTTGSLHQTVAAQHAAPGNIGMQGLTRTSARLAGRPSAIRYQGGRSDAGFENDSSGSDSSGSDHGSGDSDGNEDQAGQDDGDGSSDHGKDSYSSSDADQDEHSSSSSESEYESLDYSDDFDMSEDEAEDISSLVSCCVLKPGTCVCCRAALLYGQVMAHVQDMRCCFCL